MIKCLVFVGKASSLSLELDAVKCSPLGTNTVFGRKKFDSVSTSSALHKRDDRKAEDIRKLSRLQSLPLLDGSSKIFNS